MMNVKLQLACNEINCMALLEKHTFSSTSKALMKTLNLLPQPLTLRTESDLLLLLLSKLSVGLKAPDCSLMFMGGPNISVRKFKNELQKCLTAPLKVWFATCRTYWSSLCLCSLHLQNNNISWKIFFVKSSQTIVNCTFKKHRITARLNSGSRGVGLALSVIYSTSFVTVLLVPPSCWMTHTSWNWY